MKYFLDTEFHEFKRKPLFGKPTDTIELISIGIVAEDRREYYAISKDFDIKDVWNNEWLRNNVLINIHYELSLYECNHKLLFNKWKDIICKRDGYSKRHFHTLKKLINKYGKHNEQIAEEVKEFCLIGTAMSSMDRGTANLVYFRGEHPNEETKKHIERLKCIYVFDGLPQFYGYYSDYDWVVFCWLFGRMIDLPKGFPMYCIDLKQELENTIKKAYKETGDGRIYFGNNKGQFVYGHEIKSHPNYPKQTNEHNALADAKWDHELWKFLESL